MEYLRHSGLFIEVSENYMRRKLYISPSLIGQMEVMEKVSNEDVLLKMLNIPKIDTYNITFNYLFQCGIDDFISAPLTNYEELSNTENEYSILPLLKEKARIISESKVLEPSTAIRKIFQYYLPDNFERKEENSCVFSIQNFLAELLIASSTDSSIVRQLDSIKKDIEKAKGLLPLELWHPIKYLIDSICVDKIDLPHITHSIKSTEIERFNKILKDSPFKNYKSAHTDLDIVSVEKSAALSEIQKKSYNLYKKYFGLIDLKNSLISTLSLTPKIVDMSFGKIPGTIADLASKLLTNMLEKERRIIIYDYKPLNEEFWRGRIINPLSDLLGKNKK